jgi:hypothetical protein
MAIIPNGYSIRTHAGGINTYHLKSWILEATNDFNAGAWTVLDRQEDYAALNRPSVYAVFAVKSPPTDQFSYIRLRMIGPAYDGTNWLCIAGLELFGELTIGQ